MAMSGILKMIDEISKAKRLKTVKIWDALEKARHQEKIDQNEFWMLIRSLEKKAYINVIRSQEAGIVGISITPLGETTLPNQ